MVLGCQHLDPGVDIRGVILNRVGGSRHGAVIRRSIEESAGLPVLGVVPRMGDLSLSGTAPGIDSAPGTRAGSSRPWRGREPLPKTIWTLRPDSDRRSAPPWKIDALSRMPAGRRRPEPVTIGVIRDTAFQFYYHENLEALTDRGAKIVQISALDEKVLPPVDALYIGGGFPKPRPEGWPKTNPSAVP